MSDVIGADSHLHARPGSDRRPPKRTSQATGLRRGNRRLTLECAAGPRVFFLRLLADVTFGVKPGRTDRSENRERGLSKVVKNGAPASCEECEVEAATWTDKATPCRRIPQSNLKDCLLELKPLQKSY